MVKVYENFIFLSGHACPPRSTSARWVHLTALMSAVIIVAVYSSSVTAFLAVTREDKPFSTLTQLLSHSRYRPFTLVGSPEYTVFQVLILQYLSIL